MSQCEDSKLTHLCFADDLLIFSDGSTESLQGILAVLHEFNTLSGLAISVAKSCFFSSGLSDSEAQSLATTSGIPRGFLPIRYLGLPLCTKKLTILNCEPLLQSIRGKITSWTAKYLSFAGRQVLLSTVVAGITNFWCSAFILPKRCIKVINSMCRSYLWKGTLDGRHVAKVAWETVTTPVEEGGLGVKNLLVWNKTCALKLFWFLLFKTDSVWVAWIHQNVIKDQSIWQIKKKQSNTWLFKQLLKLRNIVYQWVRIIPGNGERCKFWIDPWSPFSPLIEYVGAAGPSQTGINLHKTLAALWRQGNWTIATARSIEVENILIFMSTISLTSNEDKLEWRMGGATTTTFCSSLVYNEIREVRPQVRWHKIVWFKRGIPKHKTLTWLVMLNRCPTRDRLLSWGLQTDPNCLLCSNYPESRNHLFFECSFSYLIWGFFATKLRLNPVPSNWESTIDALVDYNGSNHTRYLLLLAWQSSIYEIWKERNSRLHNNTRRSAASIRKWIDLTIRNRISSFRSQNPVAASSILQLWFSLD